MKAGRAVRRIGVAALALAFGLGALHVWVTRRARLEPPAIALPPDEVVEAGGVRRLGNSSAAREGKLWVVHLRGKPEEIGYASARLLRDRMLENERVLLGEFERTVHPTPARWLLMDLAQFRYHALDQGLDPARKREIAGSALGFAPDPYQSWFPTYQRFVYLNALYDIALSYEKSPLIGCTTFTWRGASAADGHTLLARAFDFDVHDIFDEDKAVFFVREDDQLGFASVAWPGLPGVVSGMNEAGLALVVHGGRAGEPRALGEPVVHALRRVLSTARSVDEAVAAFGQREPMVSHIVIAVDASGGTVAIERVPGAPPHRRALDQEAVVTNHFTGPAAEDAKNHAVRAGTSTLEREARGRELVRGLSRPATAEDAVAALRDKRGPGGVQLMPGDRRAIDAKIATHGVVFDTTARRLWVSEAPHLAGRFVAFDLGDELAETPRSAGARPIIAAETP